MGWLKDTFRGLTAKRFAFFCLVMAFIALHQGTAVATFLDGKTWFDKLLGPLRSFVITMLIFTPVLLAVVAVENRGPRGQPARVACLIAALVVGHVIGGILMASSFPLVYRGGNLPSLFRNADFLLKLQMFTGRSLYNLVYSAAALVLYHFMKQGNDATAAMHREELRREDIRRENAAVRLQVMQAQIEPHFLFNTLASVRALYQTDRTLGRQMLQHLSRYLTASLPSMRQPRSTLERELALATAYLSVHKIRMGDRLDFDVDVPAPLRTQLVPPMMIATLVENAVIHGLSPVPEGGKIRITARELHGTLFVDVIDNGRGLQDSWGGGVGLANIRSRLASEFGESAHLTLMERSGRGVIAALELPHTNAMEAKAA